MALPAGCFLNECVAGLAFVSFACFPQRIWLLTDVENSQQETTAIESFPFKGKKISVQKHRRPVYYASNW